jgi:hypothetical protein
LCRHFFHKGPNTKRAIKVSVGSCIPSRPCDRTKEHDSSGESLGLGGSFRLLLIWCHVAFHSRLIRKEPLLINVHSVKHIMKRISMIEESNVSFAELDSLGLFWSVKMGLVLADEVSQLLPSSSPTGLSWGWHQPQLWRKASDDFEWRSFSYSKSFMSNRSSF